MFRRSVGLAKSTTGESFEMAPVASSEGNFAEVLINVDQSGPVTTLSNGLALDVPWRSAPALLEYWAGKAPERIFLSERDTSGDWRSLSYAEVEANTRDLAARLLSLGCSTERPLLIASANSLLHAQLALAAQRVGVPVATVSLAYATVASDFAQLLHMVDLIGPAAIFFGDPAASGNAIAAIGTKATILAPTEHPDSPVIGLDTIAPADEADFERAAGQVGPETIARLLFTSGSTGKPKAVINTQRMLCANQAMLQAIWPVVTRTPPILVDWLPWSHTFGGNFTSNLVLFNGGSLYIDAGKPMPALIGTTLANIADVRPTAYFNVPAGYDAMVPLLERDSNLARAMFERLDFLFCAAAALPQVTRDRLKTIARKVTGREIPILAGWGSTETAPCATATWFETDHSGNIGLPLPGVEVRLVPDADKRELRVRAPTVSPGYWRAPEATKAAFDEDGFYRMGDAGVFIDEARPELGILFDGRVSENFKLTSGSWVSVGALRLALVNRGQPLIGDVVITGHDRASVGALIFVRHAACRELLGDEARGLSDAEVAQHPAVRTALRDILVDHNSGRGSNSRIERFAVLDDTPNIAALEITDKGYINQRAVLTMRSAVVDALYERDHFFV
jgi:feruloyl-CoA synthase